MKEEIEVELCAVEDITTRFRRHAASLQTRFSVGKDGQTPFKRRHHEDYASLFYHLEQLLARKSETKRLNAANSIPDSSLAFGSDKFKIVTNTLSEQHLVYTQEQGKLDQRMIKKSATAGTSRVYAMHAVGTEG